MKISFMIFVEMELLSLYVENEKCTDDEKVYDLVMDSFDWSDDTLDNSCFYKSPKHYFCKCYYL